MFRASSAARSFSSNLSMFATCIRYIKASRWRQRAQVVRVTHGPDGRPPDAAGLQQHKVHLRVRNYFCVTIPAKLQYVCFLYLQEWGHFKKGRVCSTLTPPTEPQPCVQSTETRDRPELPAGTQASLRPEHRFRACPLADPEIGKSAKWFSVSSGSLSRVEAQGVSRWSVLA